MSTGSNENPDSKTGGQAAADSSSTDYKTLLDEAAAGKVRNPEANNNNGNSVSLLDKVTEYVPAVGRMLGSGKAEAREEERAKQQQTDKVPSGVVPQRPTHDPQIERFVQDQHRSKPIGDVAE